ncbi:MAG TPA: hypothetical protein VND97_09155 [Beijerinckiaceae bacterium]|nr:hypothetical protein [Beijerinckiaceae bacterium]
MKQAAAVDWLREAFGHPKTIGYTPETAPRFEEARIADKMDEGMVDLSSRDGLGHFIAAAKRYKIWDREPKLLSPG